MFAKRIHRVRLVPRKTWVCSLVMVCLYGAVAIAQVRIEALTTLAGDRINQLTGLGLVVGLNDTGGSNPDTRQFAQNYLQNFGVRSTPRQRLLVINDTRQKTNNLSVVSVTANLPIFAREGSTIDVTVSAFDDASSLLGGNLVITPLKGVDGRVYAVASGPVNVGGFAVEGDAEEVQKNHPTVGRIPNGATVELEVPFTLASQGSFRLLLRHKNFRNARSIAAAINQAFPGTAHAEDPSTVAVIIPADKALQPVEFVSDVTELTVMPDLAAKVVINERTGTVVIGQHVRISAVAIAHGNLSIVTTETPQVSQPAPLSQGQTAVVPRTQVEVIEEQRPVSVIGATTTVAELADALNQLGVTPRDMSAIFQQLHTAESLHAELIFE